MTKTQEINERWFFDGGYEGMDKLEQVCYLVEECGWNEDSAMEMVYGYPEDNYYEEDYL